MACRRRSPPSGSGTLTRPLFMNLYSHVTPSMQREAAAKIGAALFG
jgi:hypothetical protein